MSFDIRVLDETAPDKTPGQVLFEAIAANMPFRIGDWVGLSESVQAGYDSAALALYNQGVEDAKSEAAALAEATDEALSTPLLGSDGLNIFAGARCIAQVLVGRIGALKKEV